MTLTLLLHGKHRDAPVVYQPFGPWLVPWRFASFEEEYDALRRGTGLVDYSTQAFIEVAGADRAGFLHNLLSHDIKRLTPGTGCRAAFLTPTAKYIADLFVFADAEALWLMCDVGRVALVAQTLDHYLFSERVTLTNHERRWAALAVQGPRTMACLTSLLGTAVSLPQPGDHLLVPFHGAPRRLIRHHLTSEAGVLCLVEAEHALPVWEQLQRLGAPHRLRLVGWEALNTARIEAGLPWYGVDMDESNLLPETGLEAAAASEMKGCYVGQEIVARLATYGSVSQKLMGLVVEGNVVPEAGDRIEQAGHAVGRITSGCYSPTLRCPIALGYVARGAYEPGTAVEILRQAQRLAARVVSRPIVSAT